MLVLDYASYRRHILGANSFWSKMYLSLSPEDYLHGKAVIMFRVVVRADHIGKGLSKCLFGNAFNYLRQQGVPRTIVLISDDKIARVLAKFNPKEAKSDCLSIEGVTLKAQLVEVENYQGNGL